MATGATRLYTCVCIPLSALHPPEIISVQNTQD